MGVQLDADDSARRRFRARHADPAVITQLPMLAKVESAPPRWAGIVAAGALGIVVFGIWFWLGIRAGAY